MVFPSACPVCSTGVYTAADAPMPKQGSVNAANHSCVKIDTWRQRNRFGGTVGRLRQRLIDTPPEALEAWPKVAELRARAEAGKPLA